MCVSQYESMSNEFSAVNSGFNYGLD